MLWLITMTVAWLAGSTSGVPCEVARLKCAYRVGCGRALQNYMVGCSAVLQGPFPNYCPEVCQHSLIALTSTDEGKDLMNCECSDSYCEDQKRRSEICRPEVLRAMEEDVLPCRVAQWICAADSACANALEYYNIYCKAMFHGKKCTARCINSIDILRRQDKAKKLDNCRCDGYESYDCLAIQHNMDKLCFHKHSRHHNKTGHHQEFTPTVINHNKTRHRVQEEEPTVVLIGKGAVSTAATLNVFLLAVILVTGLVT